MLRRTCRTLLVLDQVPSLPSLEAAAGKVIRASSPTETTRAIAEQRPEAVVIRGDIPWQVDAVAALAAEVRPAVIATGGSSSVDARSVDEFLSSERDALEGANRLGWALQRAQQRRRQAKRAFIDSLTGLPNRRASVRTILKEAERATRTAGSLSLVLIDLDDFKQVNEVHGHPAGDRLLRKVGAALRRAARGTELSGRIGGDEFALAIPAKLETAVRVGQRLAEALRAIEVSASVAACERRDGERLKQLYRRTDLALAALKERRRERAAGVRFEEGRPAQPPPYAS